ncbi:MAG: ABC transporter ATP-binding protein [Proteobacteria bacterium]|nr:ABC transporter ATP-binding protein [Pseudomonadota bacterium]
MLENIIETKKLAKSFGDQWALYGIDLKVKKGGVTGLVGPNGAGKTTLFSLLCGFLKPTKGSITILGHNPDHADLRGKISILPQDAILLKTISVGKQLAMLAELQGFKKNQAQEESDRVLTMVDLFSSRQKNADQLSHGMLKRIAIAQAFIGTPELILLDEPTAGLDPSTTDSIKSVIRSLGNSTSIIISSHNLEVIEDLCHKVIILKNGRLHSHEKIADLTARTKALTFRLEQDPQEIINIKDIFADVSLVTEVKLGKKGQHRLVVYFKAEADQMAEIEILKCLARANISYREMIRGERLQESVTDRLDSTS